MLRILLSLTGLAILPSCFVVKDDLLVASDGGTDGSVSTKGAETCGDMTAPLLQPGMQVVVDTTGMQNDQSASLCTGIWRTPSAGPDAFFRVQVASGEYWHFHIEPLDDGLDPFVYVMPSNCSDSGLCSRNRASNRCAVGGAMAPPDEHFGVRFDQPGTWFLGIDDASGNGGKYRISVFRPTCDGVEVEHGESCDGDVGGADTCDDACHIYLPGAVGQMSSGEGFVPNDDKFWAPELRLDASQSTVTISGNVRGECDPDVFMATIPSDAAHDTLKVSLVDSTTGLCVPTAAAPGDLRLRITDSAETYSVMAENSVGCFSAIANNLTNGKHFVEVIGGDPGASTVYRLKFELIAGTP